MEGAGTKSGAEEDKKQYGRSLHVPEETSLVVSRWYNKRWQSQIVSGRVGLAWFRKKKLLHWENSAAEEQASRRDCWISAPGGLQGLARQSNSWPDLVLAVVWLWVEVSWMDLVICSQHCCFCEGEPMCTDAGHEPCPENNHVDQKLCGSFYCILVQCMIFLINRDNYSHNYFLSFVLSSALADQQWCLHFGEVYSG